MSGLTAQSVLHLAIYTSRDGCRPTNLARTVMIGYRVTKSTFAVKSSVVDLLLLGKTQPAYSSQNGAKPNAITVSVYLDAEDIIVRQSVPGGIGFPRIIRQVVSGYSKPFSTQPYHVTIHINRNRKDYVVGQPCLSFE